MNDGLSPARTRKGQTLNNGPCTRYEIASSSTYAGPSARVPDGCQPVTNKEKSLSCIYCHEKVMAEGEGFSDDRLAVQGYQNRTVERYAKQYR